jgi:hypothetical protein
MVLKVIARCIGVYRCKRLTIVVGHGGRWQGCVGRENQLLKYSDPNKQSRKMDRFLDFRLGNGEKDG